MKRNFRKIVAILIIAIQIITGRGLACFAGINMKAIGQEQEVVQEDEALKGEDSIESFDYSEKEQIKNESDEEIQALETTVESLVAEDEEEINEDSIEVNDNNAEVNDDNTEINDDNVGMNDNNVGVKLRESAEETENEETSSVSIEEADDEPDEKNASDENLIDIEKEIGEIEEIEKIKEYGEVVDSGKIKYTISFDLQGMEVDTEPEDIIKTYGENVTLPKPRGYGDLRSYVEFKGWFEDKDFKNPYNGDTDLTDENGAVVIVYARWRVAVMFLTDPLLLDPLDDHWTRLYFEDPYIGDTIQLVVPEPSNRQTFIGWYHDEKCTDFAGIGGEDYVVEGHKIFYSKWKWDTYKIKLVLDGGTLEGDDYIIKRFEEPVTLPTPTKPGYKFVRWEYYLWHRYKDPNYNRNKRAHYDGKFDLADKKDEIFYIYPTWELAKYKLVFNSDKYIRSYVGTTANKIEYKTKTYGENIDLDDATEPMNACTFDGWYTDPSLKDEYRYDGKSDIATTDGAEVNLYPRWITKVTFKLNGHGSVEQESMEVTNGTTITLPTPEDVEGWTFDGWYDKNSKKVGNTYTIKESNTIFDAKWVEKVAQPKELKVTFVPGGGTGTMAPQTIYEGVSVKLEPNTFERKNYKFSEWYGSNGEKYNDGQVVTLTSDVTLEALWVKVSSSEGSSSSSSSSSRSSSRSSSGGSGGGGKGGVPAGSLPQPTNAQSSPLANPTQTPDQSQIGQADQTGQVGQDTQVVQTTQIGLNNENPTEGPMTAIVAYNEALATAVDSIDAKAVAKQQAQTTSYIDVSVAATAAATKQVNIVLAQVGLVDMAVALPDNVKQVANEVAAGIDLKQSIETMVAQAQNNTFLTTKAQVAKTSIGANDANWTIDTNGNISLVRGDTNQKVTDTWQSVTQNDGQSVGWYKFDSNGNMQTGLVKDGEYLYYLKEEKGNTYGQMAKNETVVVGGLIMSFNNDGALVSMDYSYETVYEKVVNATIGEKQATNNVANETNILLSGLQAIVPNAPIIY